jgi:hypothetical protein
MKQASRVLWSGSDRLGRRAGDHLRRVPSRSTPCPRRALHVTENGRKHSSTMVERMSQPRLDRPPSPVGAATTRTPKGGPRRRLTALPAADVVLTRALPQGAVRTRIVPSGPEWELTVVTADQRGVLLRSCRAIADADVDIRSAAITTVVGAKKDGAEDVALQQFVVAPGSSHRNGEPDWASLAIAIRLAMQATEPLPMHRRLPTGVRVASIEQQGPDTYEVVIEGPDRIGLLRELCETLFSFEADIVRAEVHSSDGRAEDRFLVRLSDPSALRLLLGLAT